MTDQHNIQIEGHQVLVTCSAAAEVASYTVHIPDIQEEDIDNDRAIVVTLDCPRCSERVSAEFKETERIFAAESSEIPTTIAVAEYLVSLVQSGTDVFRAYTDDVARFYVAWDLLKKGYSHFQKSRGQK